MTRPGRLISFEGGEGAGKSTQIRRLAVTLAEFGVAARTTREPGGTPGAEAVRTLLVEGAPERWTAVTEALLQTAARHDHVTRLIAPELAAGRWVLCDRFLDSTRVYQGIAGGAGLELVDRLHDLVFERLAPDLTLVLDVPVEAGLARARRARAEGRHERMGSEFHDRVRQGFLDLAAREPQRFAVVDATAGVEGVARAVRETVATRLGVALGAAG